MKFLVTPELGKLTKWLRAIGYDAEISEEDIPDLLAKATAEDRTILTRLVRLRHHRGTPVVWIRSDQLKRQLQEIKTSCGVRLVQKKLFSRCILCNVPVEEIAKEKVKEKVPPHVFKTMNQFSRCPGCRRIYWAATHWERASDFLRAL